MKKVFGILLIAGLAWAQRPAPAPVPAPAPLAPVAPLPPLASPLAEPPVPPVDIEERAFEAAQRALEIQDRIQDRIQDQMQDIQAKVMADTNFRFEFNMPRMLAQDIARPPKPPKPPTIEYAGSKGRRDNEERMYRRGTSRPWGYPFWKGATLRRSTMRMRRAY